MFEQCRWLNEPDRWALTPNSLEVTTNQATDFSAGNALRLYS